MVMLETLTTGDQEIRLATNDAEIEAAQALRYRVFFQEMGARPTPEVAATGRDFDRFDPFCDHLVVIDHTKGDGPEAVVGTYRLLRRSQAHKAGRFYTADEYDIAPLEALSGEIMELGRSCVDAAYRTKATMQLLWRGIAAYVFHYDITMMFGCASLQGTDPSKLALPLSYLYQHHLAPESMRPVALKDRYTAMDLLPPDRIHPARGLASVPPLVKGYLRLGGFVGDGAVIDHDFNTVDVCVMVKTDLISDKYFKHYDRKSRPAGNLRGNPG
ncbi:MULTISPECIES: GNAT family N-acetyltransferase [unclassified Haematospirillum]|uniref:GNAT family N-acetyltransferase n=1 Tax=unclassified Haematospirillum TaxID=2622088 RepID=UPI00143C7F65|nr:MULTISPECIES: GNAT family N-acyltransferase [unclassified Haematospirillum]NKD55384.1 GNAT family N-acetyltransferase [Haematospirillum sp. H4890]NKD75488.1 GNAT family N-acetyltransferase [Haematospirillum sp. H4485]